MKGIIFTYGQKVTIIDRNGSKTAYIASKEPNEDYLIKLSEKWPYEYGMPHFFIHRDGLVKQVKKQHYGKQLNLKIK